MRSPLPLTLAALPLLLLIGTTATTAWAQEESQVIDAYFAGGRETISLGALAGRVSLEDGENLKVIEVGRDEHTSHHAAAIRDAELPHVHEHYDIVVVLVRGAGKMLIGDSVKDVAQGSVFYVPRGVAHAFKNTAADPAIAYVIYSPPFVGSEGPGG